MSHTITVDGNIGSGKSSVLEYIGKEFPDFDVDLEPVDKWKPYLNDLYTKGTGVLEFQMRVWLDRCWIKTDKPKFTILERSPLFQDHVFVTLSKELKRLTEREEAILRETYAHTLELWQPELYIYLRSNPLKCAERILKRGRESEDNISLSYLKRIHELHETCYANIENLNSHVIEVEHKTVNEIANEIHKILIEHNGIAPQIRRSREGSFSSHN